MHRGTNAIYLPPLTYRLLAALVDAAPGVVGHDELARDVWGGRPVTPETVSQRVKLLRDALGDDAQSPRYIEVVRGRGYRLVPEVTVAVGPEASGKRRRHRAGFAAVALVAAIAAGIALFGEWRRTEEPRHSIAVLPFADMSPGQDQQYLADGMAEEILYALSRSTPLPVIARTSSFSFKGVDDDVVGIAKHLGVSHVVEGSVRRSGDRYRVTVKLVAASDGTQVWSASYDRKLVDVLRLQDEIARSVAAALELTLLGPETVASGTAPRVNAEAYDLYLRGRQRLREFRLAEAEQFLEQSLELDPDFVPAYRALGEAYVRSILDVGVPIGEYREKLRELLDRGLERAADDAALVGLSGQLARYDGDIALAEERFRRALAEDPGNVTVQMVYGMLKGDQGYPAQALEIARAARESDPLNPLLYLGDWSAAMDMGNAADAHLATERYAQLAAPGDPATYWLPSMTKIMLLGDLAGGYLDWAKAVNIETGGVTESLPDPLAYYMVGDLENGDAARLVYERAYGEQGVVTVYRHIVADEMAEARAVAVRLFVERADYSAAYGDLMVARLAVDALIDRGEANRAVAIIDGMAPGYATFRSTDEMAPQDLAPAPYPVKSIYSSYPAHYFPDYIRALRAAGQAAGAENMLKHLEAVLRWRRAQKLLVELRHVAEARALRGDYEAALEALEQGVSDRTILHGWHVFVLHNPIFADIRGHPRFTAVIARLREELERQRKDLTRMPADPG